MKFDTPIERCPMCNEYVALDQTLKECSREHECGDRGCPFEKYFTGHEFVEKGEPAAK